VTDPALRDHFAAEALKALLSRIPSHLTINPKKLAEDSYLIADAMMRARGPRAAS
jgi:hypothetical protein